MIFWNLRSFGDICALRGCRDIHGDNSDAARDFGEGESWLPFRMNIALNTDGSVTVVECEENHEGTNYELTAIVCVLQVDGKSWIEIILLRETQKVLRSDHQREISMGYLSEQAVRTSCRSSKSVRNITRSNTLQVWLIGTSSTISRFTRLKKVKLATCRSSGSSLACCTTRRRTLLPNTVISR